VLNHVNAQVEEKTMSKDDFNRETFEAFSWVQEL